MKINSRAMLLGLKPSAGTMKGEDGSTVVWDQIEVHVKSPLDPARGGLGDTVQVHKIKFPGAAVSSQFHSLKPWLGKEIDLIFEMTSDGKGGTPKLVLLSAAALKV